MDMTGLEYFVSAARNLNFTKAADECCITQTAMSLHIAKIEKELGFKLFYRDHRTVRLSSGGLTFYTEALKILRHYKEAVQRSASAAAGYKGTLRIGFTNYIEKAFLPELIGLFHKQYPDIKIVLHKSTPLAMMNDLKQGLYDMTLAFPYDAADDCCIRSEVIFSYEICTVVNKTHPLAERSSVNIAALQEETVIISTRVQSPQLYSKMQDDWHERDFKPQSVIEADSADAMLFLVEAGFGCALMPSYVKQIQSEHLRFLDLEGAPFSIDMAIAFSRENDNPAAELFLSALKVFQDTIKQERSNSQ